MLTRGRQNRTCHLSAPAPVTITPPKHCAGPKPLDLRSLGSFDAGPPTELAQRRAKFNEFEGLCSEIAPGLFVGSDAVAKSRETLRKAGITHVVNTVGQVFPNYFPDELQYRRLRLLGALLFSHTYCSQGCCSCPG